MTELGMNSKIGFWGGLAAVGLIGGGTWFVASAMRLDNNWEDALYTTAVIFSALALALRPAWSRPAFWKDLLAVLAVHAIVVSLVVHLFTANSMRVGGPWRTLAAIVEGLLLLGFLWRRNIAHQHGRGS